MVYDLVIVGTGPAGLIASIYASRYKLNNLVIGKVLGGELALASKIENYPGIISVPGPELCRKIGEQTEKLGAKIIYEEISRLEKIAGGFAVISQSQEKYFSKSLIVATGSERRRLKIPGEKELTGRGVSYCTTCDAPFYRGKKVAVVGGSDAAVTGAIHTAEFADQVYIIYRKDQLRAEPVWLEEVNKLIASGKVKVIYNTNLKEILNKNQSAKRKIPSECKNPACRQAGQSDNVELKNEPGQSQLPELVGAVRLDKPYNGSEILEVDGVFIEIGGVPGTSLVQPLGVALDETGHVKVSESMETNIPGLFCAGDMVDKSQVMKQAITAMAFGAIAAASAYRYLKGQTAPQIRGE